jgi:hypothetical protein
MLCKSRHTNCLVMADERRLSIIARSRPGRSLRGVSQQGIRRDL